MPPNAAFERVLEQMVLRVLQDIQSKGVNNNLELTH